MQLCVAALFFVHLAVLTNAKSSFTRGLPRPIQTTESTTSGEEATDSLGSPLTTTSAVADEETVSSSTTTAPIRGSGMTTEGWSINNAGSRLKCEACKMIAGWLKSSAAPSGSVALSIFLNEKCGSTLILAGLCKEMVRNQIEKFVPTDTDLCRRSISAC